MTQAELDRLVTDKAGVQARVREALGGGSGGSGGGKANDENEGEGAGAAAAAAASGRRPPPSGQHPPLQQQKRQRTSCEAGVLGDATDRSRNGVQDGDERRSRWDFCWPLGTDAVQERGSSLAVTILGSQLPEVA